MQPLCYAGKRWWVAGLVHWSVVVAAGFYLPGLIIIYTRSCRHHFTCFVIEIKVQRALLCFSVVLYMLLCMFMVCEGSRQREFHFTTVVCGAGGLRVVYIMYVVDALMGIPRSVHEHVN